MIHLPGRFVRQGLVRTVGVVELDVLADCQAQFSNGLVFVFVDLLGFERTPKALDKDVVVAATTTGHADGDLVVFQDPGEGLRGKLAALVGMEDLRARLRRRLG